MEKIINLTGLSRFLAKCKEIFADKIVVTGIFSTYDNEFICTSGHSIDDIRNALLAGTLMIVDVVVNPNADNTRYITNDISLFYDSGTWYATSHTFATGTIDNWVVQS